MGITTRQIAKQFKIHHSTVSRALQDDPRISEARRKEIKQFAKKKNYVPNMIAKSFFSKKTYTIGIIVSDLTNSFFSTVTKGIEDFVNQKDYSVFICNTDESIDEEKKDLNTLLEKRVEGIIVASATLDKKYFSELSKIEAPIVLIDRFPLNAPLSYVGINNFEAAYKATKYLLSLGHRRIAHIMGRLESERMQGYSQALKDAGIKNTSNYITQSGLRINDGYKAMQELLKFKQRPTAVLAVTDAVGMGAIAAIKDEGLDVPRDISICGFDDIEYSQFTNPPLTAIRQPVYEIGRRAAEILLNDIKNKHSDLRSKRTHVLLDTELVIRKSCKKLKQK